MSAFLLYFPHITTLTLNGRSDEWQRTADAFNFDQLIQQPHLKEVHIKSSDPSGWRGYVEDNMTRVQQLFRDAARPLTVLYSQGVRTDGRYFKYLLGDE